VSFIEKNQKGKIGRGQFIEKNQKGKIGPQTGLTRSKAKNISQPHVCLFHGELISSIGLKLASQLGMRAVSSTSRAVSMGARHPRDFGKSAGKVARGNLYNGFLWVFSHHANLSIHLASLLGAIFATEFSMLKRASLRSMALQRIYKTSQIIKVIHTFLVHLQPQMANMSPHMSADAPTGPAHPSYFIRYNQIPQTYTLKSIVPMQTQNNPCTT
jgi:hypothetical protein